MVTTIDPILDIIQIRDIITLAIIIIPAREEVIIPALEEVIIPAVLKLIKSKPGTRRKLNSS